MCIAAVCIVTFNYPRCVHTPRKVAFCLVEMSLKDLEGPRMRPPKINTLLGRPSKLVFHSRCVRCVFVRERVRSLRRLRRSFAKQNCRTLGKSAREERVSRDTRADSERKERDALKKEEEEATWRSRDG